MTIQILGIRTWERGGETITSDTYFKNGWRAPSVPELLKNLEKYLDQVPTDKRWNLFYTVANCDDTKRGFKSQDVIAFDIDGVPEEQRPRAATAAMAALGLAPEKTALVSSGGGLHLIVQLATPVTSKDFFKEHKADYGHACDKVNAALKAAGCEGQTDTTIFEPRRILRLPGTLNRKPGKPERQCRLLASHIEPQVFQLRSFSPIGGPVGKENALPARAMARYGKTDTPAVLAGCGFLRWAKAEPEKINEPQWYAALSIVARLTEHGGADGNDLAHELSSGHPSYSLEETDKKIAQALDASGPRTCHNINALWGKCQECPHFEKVASPIQIVSADKIATELTGFHRISANGKATPMPEDLRRYFKRERHYRTAAKVRTTYVWNGTHYEEFAGNQIEQYAHDHYEPKVGAGQMRSFRELVGGTEVVHPEWFNDTTAGKANFLNGTLDLVTSAFVEATPAVGFRYVLPYRYDPTARAPRFEKFLARVTGGDKPMQQALMEYVGYALSGDDYWLHKALVLTGEGSNGKSTFMKVLWALAGKNNVSSVGLKELEQEYQRALFDGKLMNISDETPTKALMDSSYFKAMCSGSTVTVRPPYKEPYSLDNRAKFIITCNRLPDTLDTSYGFFRRLLIVPFDQVFTKESDPEFDPHLARKLLEELPGIFNIAMTAYLRLKKQGEFTHVEAVKQALKSYESAINTVKHWFDEEVTPLTNGHAGAFTPMDDLYQNYKLSTQNNTMHVMSSVHFAREIAKLVPKEAHRREYCQIGGGKKKQKMGLRGFGLVRDYGHEDHEAPAVVQGEIPPPEEFC